MAIAAATLIGFALQIQVVSATHGGLHDFERQYVSELTGEAVVDDGGTAGQGDPDGSGHVRVAVHPDPAVESSLCWWIEVQGIATPTGAHLHAGEAGTNGPIVATLEPHFPDAATCVKHDDPTVIQAIIDDPSGFYVDVHTAEFPDGALRGQLPNLACMLMVASPNATGPGDDATLAVGEELRLVGDFLPDVDVVVDFIDDEGTAVETVSIASDAQGEFTFFHVFEPGDEGSWTVDGRVDGTDCQDSAAVTVTPGEPAVPGDGRGATTGSPAAEVIPDTATAPTDDGGAGSLVPILVVFAGMVLIARTRAQRT